MAGGIVKQCKKHGALTQEMVYVNPKTQKKVCRECKVFARIRS
jgi:hypothetical protein